MFVYTYAHSHICNSNSLRAGNLSRFVRSPHTSRCWLPHHLALKDKSWLNSQINFKKNASIHIVSSREPESYPLFMLFFKRYCLQELTCRHQLMLSPGHWLMILDTHFALACTVQKAPFHCTKMNLRGPTQVLRKCAKLPSWWQGR